MTLVDGTVIEGESYDDIIHHLGLESVFEEIHDTPLTAFNPDDRGVLPVTVLTETLTAAPDRYYFDAPATGSEPRFRVIELHDLP